MVHIPKEKRKKWDYKSQKLIFVGYDDNSKAFRCIDQKTRKVIVSRDVIFHENELNTDKLYTSIDEVRDSEDEIDTKSEGNFEANNADQINPNVDGADHESSSSDGIELNDTNAGNEVVVIEDDSKLDGSSEFESQDPDYEPE